MAGPSINTTAKFGPAGGVNKKNDGIPAKLPCRRCKKYKDKARFSNRNHSDWAAAEKRSLHKTVEFKDLVTCMDCTSAQVQELKCHWCRTWKGLDEFSKAQRRNPDRAKCWPCQEKIDKMDPAMLAVGHEVESDRSDEGDSDDDDDEDANYYVSDEDDDDETTTATGGVTFEDTSVDNTTTTGNTKSLSYFTDTTTPSGASVSRAGTIDGKSTADGHTNVGTRSRSGNGSETASSSGLSVAANRGGPPSGFNPNAYGRPKSSRAASLADSAASTRVTVGSRDRFPKIKAYIKPPAPKDEEEEDDDDDDDDGEDDDDDLGSDPWGKKSKVAESEDDDTDED